MSIPFKARVDGKAAVATGAPLPTQAFARDGIGRPVDGGFSAYSGV